MYIAISGLTDSLPLQFSTERGTQQHGGRGRAALGVFVRGGRHLGGVHAGLFARDLGLGGYGRDPAAEEARINAYLSIYLFVLIYVSVYVSMHLSK